MSFGFHRYYLTMLPSDILALIHSMVDSMNEYADLPCLRAVQKIVNKTDEFVIDCLGNVLNMQTPALDMMRFQIHMNYDFIFYFRFSILQRTRMITMLQEAIGQHKDVSRLIWLFVLRKPVLCDYTEYKQLFTEGLYCRIMCFLMPN